MKDRRELRQREEDALAVEHASVYVENKRIEGSRGDGETNVALQRTAREHLLECIKFCGRAGSRIGLVRVETLVERSPHRE